MADVTPEGGSSIVVECSQEQAIPVVRLAGELDLSSVDAAYAAIDALGGTGDGGIIFDLEAVTFMDSSGIAFLLTALERFGQVRLRRPRELVRQVIAITGLEGSLPVE